MGTRTIYSQQEGHHIAEARQLGKAGLDHWAKIRAAMIAKKLTPLKRVDFVRLTNLADIFSSARGAQLAKTNAGKDETRKERRLGVTINARFTDWRDRAKIMLPDDKAAHAFIGVGRVPKATDTGGLIDFFHGLKDATTSKGKSKDEAVAAKKASSVLLKIGVTKTMLKQAEADNAALALADTTQMITKRMAKSGTSAKDAILAETKQRTSRVRKALDYLFKDDAATAALFAKSTPKHQVRPRTKAVVPPSAGSTPTKG